MQYGVDDGTDQLVNRRGGSIATVIVISALAAAGTTSALMLLGGGRAPSTTTVPVLVGLAEAEARLVAEGAKLTLEVVGAMPDPVVARGSVARQRPLAGEQARAGTRVQVTLSRGVPIRLPNLVNLSLAVVERRLAALGLRRGELRRQQVGDLPDGTVVASDPAAGSSVPAGAAVDLVLSQKGAAEPRPAASNPAPTRATPTGPIVTVPKVTGVRRPFAEQRLRAAGLVPGKLGYQADEDHIEDYVLRQSPEPGASAPRGSAVDLVINRL
jgi:serine/threonine-protein kinase